MQKIFILSFLGWMTLSSFPVISQSIINGGFEILDANHNFKDWRWGEAPGFKFSPDSLHPYSGNYSALLENVDNLPSGAAFIQPLTFKEMGLKKWRFSVMMRTESASPCGVIFNAFCGQFTIVQTDMLEKNIQGTKDWQRVGGEIALPNYTNALTFGGLLSGSGKVWFDDFKMEEIPLVMKPISGEVKKYFADFIDTLKCYSVRRDSIELDKLEKDLALIAEGVEKTTEVSRAMEFAFSALKDSKGGYIDSATIAQKENAQLTALKMKPIVSSQKAKPMRYPVGGVWKENYAVVRISNFEAEDSTQAKLYTDSLIHLIKTLDQQNIKGWMIDFRECVAADRDALLKGLSPFFDKDTAITLKHTTGFTKMWNFPDSSFYKVKNKSPLVILTGTTTSGVPEIGVIALKGVDNAHQIGEPTRGLEDETSLFELSNKSKILISTGSYSDGNKKEYVGRVYPDEIVRYPKNIVININEDGLVAAAIHWFESFKKNK